MSDRLTMILVAALRPVERWHAWRIEKARAKGKFRRPADIGSPCVTTKQREPVS